jgi:DNA (cytosine-5)-methyltransferase 1
VVQKTLEQLGYDVFAGKLNAGNFGIPQARNRVYMVCVRQDLDCGGFRFPTPTNEDVVLADIVLPVTETKGCVVDLSGRRFTLDRRPVPRTKRPVRIGTVNGGGMGERIYHPNGQAVTLCTGGGGLGAKTGLFLIDGVVRKLAPRECARLSGFPETFKLNSSWTACRRQFGNTIVVDVLQHVICAIVKQNVLRAHQALKVA